MKIPQSAMPTKPAQRPAGMRPAPSACPTWMVVAEWMESGIMNISAA
jgi:hypothetical protein